MSILLQKNWRVSCKCTFDSWILLRIKIPKICTFLLEGIYKGKENTSLKFLAGFLFKNVLSEYNYQ